MHGLGIATINLSAKCEVSVSTHYVDMTGDTQSASSPRNTGIGDRLRADIPPTSVYNQSPRPTQPPTLCGTGMIAGQSAVMLCGWE